MNTKIEVKHTPTPWEVRPSSKSGNGTAWRDIVSTGCEYSPSYVGEAIDIDASYIVRAVNSHEELLEAAKEYVANCPRRNTLFQHDIMCDGPFCSRFRKAIAKAEGK